MPVLEGVFMQWQDTKPGGVGQVTYTIICMTKCKAVLLLFTFNAAWRVSSIKRLWIKWTKSLQWQTSTLELLLIQS